MRARRDARSGRAGSRRLASLVLALGVPAAGAGAQLPAPAASSGGGRSAAPAVAPARPEFQVLRFAEDWSAIRRTGAPGAADALKHIPLTAGGAAYLSLGGQTRYRAEGVRAFLLGGAGDRDDTFTLSRTMLHADLHAGPHLRAFVEGRHATAAGRALPGGRRPLDQDAWDVQNAFVDIACCAATGAVAPVAMATLRVGRQEIALGRERLLSPLDWANARRSFEGARLQARRGSVGVDAFWARPVVVRQSQRNRPDTATRLWGATVQRRGAAPGRVWELYALGLEQDGPVAFAGATGAHRRVTLGGRIARPIRDARTTLEIEAAGQAGRLADQRVRAWFVASEASRAFAAPLKPVVTLGADYASGDARSGDAASGTFHQLFPLGHAFAGYMDHLGRQNLGELRAVVGATLPSRVAVRVAGHQFVRARRADAIYGVGGAPLRAAATDGSRSIGQELDVTAGRRIGRHLRLDAGYGHFVPGAAVRRTPTGATSSDWAFATATLTF